MSQYTVRGRFRTPHGWEEFEKPFDAENENLARERAYSIFGSKHGVKRTQIELNEVEAQ